ncbi:MAG TPA: hypothetical protein DD426_07105 [Clostridiaceae bacterium]|nr:hypothetical protein [Clostridiaceae bacterium]
MSILKFTGNPFIDNGAAVIAASCNKTEFEDINEKDIMDNLDNFFDCIKFCYNYENAAANERKYSKKGLKQHLLQIYTTNHYLHGINNYIEDRENPGKKKKVSNFNEYKQSIKIEVEALLRGNGAHVHNQSQNIEGNICRFCGKPADILLSKDIFPLMAGKEVNNLGLIYCCNGCYLANLFYYANMVNIKKDEKNSGFYMMYGCNNEKALIEIARLNLLYLRQTQFGSIKTYIGNLYESLVNDMEDKLRVINKIIRVSNLNFSAYFIINDNRGGTFMSINIPDGIWKFIVYCKNVSNDWEKIKGRFKEDDYKKFIEGNLSFNYFYGLKDCLIYYLREVKKVNESLISAIERISNNLLKTFRIKGDSWPIDYEKKFSKQKSYEFLNSLFNINENYFKVNGQNLFDFNDIKLLLDNAQKSNFIYSLAKYFIYNSMNNKEREIYVTYCKGKQNINIEEDRANEN